MSKWDARGETGSFEKIPMKEPTEAEITKGIRGLLKMLGIFHWKNWGGPMSTPGVADILGIYKGKPLAIEVKRSGLEPNEKQKDFLNRWKEEGGIGFVAHSIEDVIMALGLKDKFK